MEAGRAALLVLAMLTALNWALHYYTQLVTYRLFPQVAEVAGGAGFVVYHRAYEARLPFSIYIPWSALTLASIALVAVHPAGVGFAVPVGLLVLNASIAPISLAFAAPRHREIDAHEELTARQASALLRWNGVRLAIASVSLVAVFILALAELT